MNGYHLEDTKDWDWSLNNAEIGRRYEISRERVRQIRNSWGFPPAAIRGMKEREIIDTVELLKNKDLEISIDNINSFLKEPASEPYLRIVLNKHNIPFIHGNRKYPWDKINWNLPNTVICEIWGIPYPDVVEFRTKSFQGDPLWKKWNQDQKFQRDLAEELSK